jgi:hypothetical protein
MNAKSQSSFIFLIEKFFLIFLFFSCASSMAQTFPIWEQKGYGLIDKTGKEIFSPIAFSVDELNFNPVIIYDPVTQKYGLTSKDKTVVLPPIYEVISRYSSGFLLKLNEKSGYADRSGKIIISPKYSQISVTDLNSLIVFTDSLCGMMDTTGKKLSGTEYSTIDNRSFNNCFIAKKNNKEGLLDQNGILKIPCIYNEISPAYQCLFYLVKKNDKMGI